jgi:hypothetical protein
MRVADLPQIRGAGDLAFNNLDGRGLSPNHQQLFGYCVLQVPVDFRVGGLHGGHSYLPMPNWERVQPEPAG